MYNYSVVIYYAIEYDSMCLIVYFDLLIIVILNPHQK